MYKHKKKVDGRKTNSSTMLQENGLTPKEEVFIESYLIHLNASKAARDAGYNAGAIQEKGWKVLQLPRVKDRIDKRIKDRYNRLEIEQDDVVKRLQAIAFFDISELYTTEGDFVGLENLAPEQRVIIKSVTKDWKKITNNPFVDYEEVVEIELHDQQKALEHLAIHLGMLKKQNENLNLNANIDVSLKVEELKKLGTDKLTQLNRILSNN